jgi:hypothetical protein
MRAIWKHQYGNTNEELWLGIPTWDPENKEGKLSVKFVYRKNGRIPRTSPEVPEKVVVDMIKFLGEHGRLSAAQLDELEELLQRIRHKKS